MREAGASQDQLLALYIARVRSTLEYGAQVYHNVINGVQSEELESVQLKCLQIVRGRTSESYARNLCVLELQTLEDRRKELVKTFAIACYRSDEHRWWFTPHPPFPLNT